ncbi:MULTISPECIES: hypothetical protein [Pseudomonas]|jgi:hypothetical protein|uniref:Uncharacterized protein n=2 Tax=Pseudomonas TaxID=286 RepID=A0A2T4FR08_9PSED|nr:MULTISPECIES: hypothetical protein [Pseudomonas]OCW30443.1 hypothetical protein BBG20_00265 [Pseudomonas aylmerensis]POA24718.1 hypothetical protein C1895_13595 [Pseudomonas sp. FW305-3-2-15-E-TSA4]POA41961.1 hypothetical protein C1894_12795 [Pseudomonas sp. FW305-3-2-15-E-TSA2]PTC25860.1 hypothetical protein C9382_23180 [Pseudomonas aylmerensis]TNB92730.1 hypothetical protein FHG55_20740 [Pseudomonas jessenii]
MAINASLRANGFFAGLLESELLLAASLELRLLVQKEINEKTKNELRQRFLWFVVVIAEPTLGFRIDKAFSILMGLTEMSALMSVKAILRKGELCPMENFLFSTSKAGCLSPHYSISILNVSDMTA